MTTVSNMLDALASAVGTDALDLADERFVAGILARKHAGVVTLLTIPQLQRLTTIHEAYLNPQEKAAA